MPASPCVCNDPTAASLPICSLPCRFPPYLADSRMFAPRFRLIHDPASPRVDVVWINHAGGATNTLAHRLRGLDAPPPARIQSPWMPVREELLDVTFDGNLDEMASLLAGAIGQSRREQADDLPLVLVGHSFGSLIAYRIACELAAVQVSVHRLAVLSFPAPDNLSHQERLDDLSDEELVARVDEQFGGIPAHVREDSAMHEFFVPALRFDVGLLASYQHPDGAEPLSIPISAICGIDDPSVDVAQMNGWKKMTASQFRLRSMPGGHFFPLDRLAEVLEAACWDTW